MMPAGVSKKRPDRIGQRFGLLVVVEPTQRTLSSGRKMPAWLLRCDCGREAIAMTVNLVKGKHRSCGCQRDAHMVATRGDWGAAKLPEYRVWMQMVQRCGLPTAPNFHWYGERGITVCRRWRKGEGDRTGFECFIADMGRRPDGLTIDRIDVHGNYEPGNCRWATWQVQNTNKRPKGRAAA